MKDEKAEPGCSWVFTVLFSMIVMGPSLGIILKFLYRVYQFLSKPDLLERSLEMVGGAALFLAGGSLFVWLFLIMPPPKLPWEDDDLYRDRSTWYQKLWMSPVIFLGLCSMAIFSLFIPLLAFYADVIAPRLRRSA
jgi:hypothetical protein